MCQILFTHICDIFKKMLSYSHNYMSINKLQPVMNLDFEYLTIQYFWHIYSDGDIIIIIIIRSLV